MDSEATEVDVGGVSASTIELRLLVVAVGVAILPIVVATVRALAGDWMPVGDNAFFLIRARDVLSDHRPLLGTWSSSSLTVGIDVNNPGALFFYALALPVRLLGGRAGVAVGTAVINSLAICGIAYVAFRRVGVVGATIAVAATACVCWSMGSELLFEPWQPHSLLLPFFLLILLLWSVACGDLVVMPWAAGLASLVLQTHLSYAVVIPALCAWAIVGLALSLDASRRRDPESWPSLRRRTFRTALVTVVVLALFWLGTIVEQFTSDGDGNLTRLLESLRASDVQTLGFSMGARVLAGVVALPPWFLRPSFTDTLQFRGGNLPSLGVAVLSLAALAGVLAWCVRDCRRRSDRECSRALVTGAVGLVAGLLTLGRAPETIFGGITPHTIRWLWPLGAFVAFAVATTAVRRFARPSWSQWLVALVTTITVLVALLNLPTHTFDAGTGSIRKGSPLYAAITAGNAQDESFAAVAEIDDQLDDLEDAGPLVVDNLFDNPFDPYGTAILAELQRRGIEFVARDPSLVRQLGPDRQFDGTNARGELSLRTGDAVRSPPSDARRVGIVEGLSPAEQRTRARLEPRVRAILEQTGRRIERDDDDALRDLPVLRRQLRDGRIDPAELVRYGELATIADDGLVPRDGQRDLLRRFEDLETRYEHGTVAVYLGPITDESNR